MLRTIVPIAWSRAVSRSPRFVQCAHYCTKNDSLGMPFPDDMTSMELHGPGGVFHVNEAKNLDDPELWKDFEKAMGIDRSKLMEMTGEEFGETLEHEGEEYPVQQNVGSLSDVEPGSDPWNQGRQEGMFDEITAEQAEQEQLVSTQTTPGQRQDYGEMSPKHFSDTDKDSFEGTMEADNQWALNDENVMAQKACELEDRGCSSKRKSRAEYLPSEESRGRRKGRRRRSVPREKDPRLARRAAQLESHIENLAAEFWEHNRPTIFGSSTTAEKVTITPDLQNVCVYWSRENADCIKIAHAPYLRKLEKRLRLYFSKHLRMKRMPKVHLQEIPITPFKACNAMPPIGLTTGNSEAAKLNDALRKIRDERALLDKGSDLRHLRR